MDRSLLFSAFPFPEMVLSDHLTLRPVRKSDENDLLALYADNLVTRYLGDNKPQTKEEANRYIVQCKEKYEHNNAIFWAISLSDQLIGIILLKSFDFEHHYCSTGYLLSRSHWGGGIVSEALKAVMDFAFNKLHIHRIEAQVFVAHPASCRVLKKNGFTKEGRLKENFLIDGKFEDSFLYAITQSDYDTTR